MTTIEDLTKSFTESLSLIQQLKSQMDEIQSVVSPEIKNIHSKSQELLNEIGKSAEDVFKQLDQREEDFNKKYDDAIESIGKKAEDAAKNLSSPTIQVSASTPVLETKGNSMFYVSGSSYRMADGKVEVKFSGIPPVFVREKLKSQKFGWSKAKAVWIGNADRHPENVQLAKEITGQN